jgi:succinyl-CoA synthetase beta subunit
MNLHEYQGKQLFAEYGLPVSTGYACDTPEETVAAVKKIGGDMWLKLRYMLVVAVRLVE